MSSRHTLKFEEKDWMKACDATYKASIRFNDFLNKGSVSHHPFISREEMGYNGYNWAVYNALEPKKGNLEEYFNQFIGCMLSRDNKFGKVIGDTYAHHLSAEKFGEYCKKSCGDKVLHIVGTVTQAVTLDEETIECIILDTGEKVSADLFIDCSGFSSILLNKTLKVPFISYEDTLINNKAIACPISYKEESSKSKELNPFTDCTALANGWAWNAPLWGRTGTGYVYSDKFCSKDQATQEFENYLVDRFGRSRVDTKEFRYLDVRTGKHKVAWKGNCTSLVLTTGFIEPIESTGLALAALQIESLVTIVKTEGYSTLDRAIFNNSIDKYMEEIHDFVTLHYLNTRRDDSEYWEHLSKSMEPTPKTLSTIYNIYRNGDIDGQFFPFSSWEAILVGFNILGAYTSLSTLSFSRKVLNSLDEKDAQEILDETYRYVQEILIRNEGTLAVQGSHYQYLKDNIYG